jgi:hypothetical protein
MDAGSDGWLLSGARLGLAGDLEFKVRGDFLAGAPGDAGESHAGAEEDLAGGLIDEAAGEEIAGGKGESVPDVG